MINLIEVAAIACASAAGPVVGNVVPRLLDRKRQILCQQILARVILRRIEKSPAPAQYRPRIDLKGNPKTRRKLVPARFYQPPRIPAATRQQDLPADRGVSWVREVV